MLASTAKQWICKPRAWLEWQSLAADPTAHPSTPGSCSAPFSAYISSCLVRSSASAPARHAAWAAARVSASCHWARLAASCWCRASAAAAGQVKLTGKEGVWATERRADAQPHVAQLPCSLKRQGSRRPAVPSWLTCHPGHLSLCRQTPLGGGVQLLLQIRCNCLGRLRPGGGIAQQTCGERRN